MRKLAIFDLDDTLIAGDSDHAWIEFLLRRGLAGEDAEARNRHFLQQYRAGELDISAWLQFCLAPLASLPQAMLQSLRLEFMDEVIRPLQLPAAIALLDMHRRQDAELLIITSTNRFVAEPIAAALNVPQLLATEPEQRDGRYTGRTTGAHCHREGKLLHLAAWLDGRGFELKHSCAYSDSHNDLPLLSAVGQPVAVDPDPRLLAHARASNWEVISLRAGPKPERISTSNRGPDRSN